MKMRFLLLGLLTAAFTFSSVAETPTPEATLPATEQQQKAEYEKKLTEFLQSLSPQTGTITLKDGVAQLKLTEDFYFLNAQDAKRVLVDLWGNPPESSSDVLGMLVPRKFKVSDDQSWVVTLEYEESGYVSDADAEKIDYASLLKEMREGMAAANPEREKQGYSTVELVGWAAAPRYDQQSHKLHWAKELRFGGNEENTLNYNIRVLGRRGVLVLNAISVMPQLPEIEEATPQILSMVDFQPGHQYADYNPATDRMAEYGIAALIGGTMASKMGLFKVIGTALLAGKKFVIMGAVALAAVLRKFFGGKE